VKRWLSERWPGSNAATVTRSRDVPDVCLELSNRRASLIRLEISEREDQWQQRPSEALLAVGEDGPDTAFGV